MKNFNDTIGIRTRDLPAYGTADTRSRMQHLQKVDPQFLQGSRKAYLRVVGETDLTYPYTRVVSETHALYTDSLRAKVRRVPVFTFEGNCIFVIQQRGEKLEPVLTGKFMTAEFVLV